ncbi:hypothetical protein N5J43_01555 [Pseudomonas nicosulfuronedens]|uniref:hypothetical protein n=1 Tax=Pseudomonas nicosulfuronedens TaxID=2571105 RepID=UPI00244BEA9B|nr:hypothetical protein [Pseudomonas nicosulfuronedens]MDH1007570.1 hypothetical protein [Pseudomonas nicosulfuronedens]MDH1977615.1 hypothetical protein [Pseudomonas nicosulfuronedens]MDH2025785.1 hypothetical protein [Pseudomonas nicosulfuronedens]
MFWSAPITLACIFVMFVSLAYNDETDRQLARCLIKSSELIDSNSKLQDLWDKSSQKSDLTLSVYHSEIITTLIIGNSDCWPKLNKFDEQIKTAHPNDLSSLLKNEAKKIYATPLNFYGVEIPEKATIGIIGTNIKIDFLPFIRSLQIALSPILIIWLGSIYQTRHRELQIVSRSEDIAEIFPHIVNVYPVGFFPSIKRKRFLAKYRREILGGYFILLRATYISIIIVPPTLFFITGMYYTGDVKNFLPQLAFGTLLVLFNIAILAGETTVFYKVFPGPLAFWKP